MISTSNNPERVSKTEIEQLFRRQREHAPKVAATTFRERKEKLERMLRYILENTSEIEKATYADFKKPAMETRVSEILTLTSEIRYHLKNLNRWMKPHRVPTPLFAIGTDSYIQYEAKGTALILSPWNFPISLALKPLIAAVSAGCTAILKPSEFTPNSSAFIKKLAKNVFNPEEVSVVEGAVEVSTDLLELPFDHIFFIGSSAVGKIVMKAAATHLTSVSLELGGKSPVIIDETADIKSAARQIAWGKFINNGQTCIAPDYVLVDKKVEELFLTEIKAAIASFYSGDDNNIKKSTDYGRVISAPHFDRLQGLFENAVKEGAQVINGGTFDREDLFIAPTVIANVNDSMHVMQEEIFGPILPVISFQTLEEAIAFVNHKEKPLAIYLYTRSTGNTDRILNRTSSGNAMVNEMLTQFQHTKIPFGGIGNSGMGKANGFFGFQEFSNSKGVIKRQFGTIKFLYPPFTPLKEKILNLLLKFI